MPPRCERRGVSSEMLALARAVQNAVGGRLAGGAALAGLHLEHRRTRDIDLYVEDRRGHREAVRVAPVLGREVGLELRIVRDGGTFARGEARGPSGAFEVDLVYEPLPPIALRQELVEGLRVESLEDMRASKLTCLLSRAEPRDLVDVLFLERAGFRVEDDLELALQKDAGIDPGLLAWLLEHFPTAPMPQMLLPLEREELIAFRDELRERLRRLSVGESSE